MGKWSYGVMFDAGSSGTRVHIYRWEKPERLTDHDDDDEELHELPEVKTEKNWTKKTHPGISTFGEKPAPLGPDHLKPLLDHALSIVPKDEVSKTPVFLLATAGMRLLDPDQQTAVLDEACRYTKEKTDFLISDCSTNFQVIPGATEGLYGWLSANYLLGAFNKPKEHDHGKNHHTYGFLDMGGASAQIAFVPNATETTKHADDLKLVRMRTLNGEQSDYHVFVTTWMGFGAQEARRRYSDALLGERPKDSPQLHIPDPCLPTGLAITQEGKVILPGSPETEGTTPYFYGTGLFADCLHATLPLLEKDKACPDPPCMVHGVHVPNVDFEVNHFVGVSEYWHTTHQIFEMGYDDRAYDFQTYQKRVNEFCGQSWQSISEGVKNKKWGKKVDEETAVRICFKAAWLINMLHDGIGVPRVPIEQKGTEKDGGTGKNATTELLHKAKQEGYLAPFQGVNKIDDTEVSWTLGKMILYASSQIPPASSSVQSVGFGSNPTEPSVLVPADFEYAGPDVGSSSLSDTISDWTDPSHLLSGSNLPHRAPGFALITIILLLIAILLCGRERRTNIFRKLLGRPDASASLARTPSDLNLPSLRSGKRRGGLMSRIPYFGSSNSGPRYERLMEEGEMQLAPLAHPSEFDNYSDDTDDAVSSGGSVKGKPGVKGRRTPAAVGGGRSTPRTGGSGSSHVRGNSGSGSGSGSGTVGLGLSGVRSSSDVNLAVDGDNGQGSAASVNRGTLPRSRPTSPLPGINTRTPLPPGPTPHQGYFHRPREKENKD